MTPVVGSPPWTPEEDERIRKLALTGISVAAMAPQHGSGPQPRRPVEDSGGKSRNQGLGLKAKGR